jgi:hypothetical protein
VAKIISILMIFIYSCNINNADYKNPVGVSKSIEESIKNTVFIKQLELGKVNSSTKSYTFPIHKIWLEKSWHFELDSNGQEIIIVDNEKALNIVFLLRDNSDLTEQNLLNKWVIWQGDKKVPCSNISGMPVISISDTTDLITSSFTIYSQKTPNDFKRDIVELFTFNIKN